MFMKKFWHFSLIPTGGCIYFVATFVIMLFLVKLLWSWTIPDLFPEAVKQEMITGDLTWYAAFKLAIFLSVMAWVAGIRRGRRE
jgi:hypothetical protein